MKQNRNIFATARKSSSIYTIKERGREIRIHYILVYLFLEGLVNSNCRLKGIKRRLEIIAANKVGKFLSLTTNQLYGQGHDYAKFDFPLLLKDFDNRA